MAKSETSSEEQTLQEELSPLHFDQPATSQLPLGLQTEVLLHPEVLRVLQQIGAPSPPSVVRDREQPMSGSLRDLLHKRVQREVSAQPSVVKPIPVSLNIGRNALLRKRRQGVGNPHQAICNEVSAYVGGVCLVK